MRNIAPFGLRMSEALKEAVAERAKRNGRSMNSEIVNIIEDALLNDRVTPPD
ncbi:TPA: Arc family DNA-binding protein, partial [Klebsiella pneumoniae]